MVVTENIGHHLTRTTTVGVYVVLCMGNLSLEQVLLQIYALLK